MASANSNYYTQYQVVSNPWRELYGFGFRPRHAAFSKNALRQIYLDGCVPADMVVEHTPTGERYTVAELFEKRKV
jgi:hypothetical protein